MGYQEDYIWPKTISVDKRIVRILSASTYDNFPNALKEMITNSYDADASLVNIIIDQKGELIIIEDDGVGMSQSDFSLYLRIAGLKRDKKQKTAAGRAVVGQFGVGFLAVFPFFKNFSIETKKANSDEVLHADIPCSLYFGQNSIDISQIQVQGGIRRDKSKLRNQYTKIKLFGYTELTRAFFNPSIKLKPRQGSILNKTSLDILKWRLSEDLPLKYSDNNLNKVFDKYSPNLPFQVKVNTDLLTRKTYGKEILEIHKKEFQQIGKIKFRYFISTDRAAINEPIEGRYLKIRNLNIGVGERTSFGLGTEVGGARSRLHWLTGEVHIVEGLNHLIAVARDKFNYDIDYEELKDFFIKRLSFHSNQLEEENTINQFVKNAKDSSSIKDINLLDPKKLSKKITKLERGKTEKEYIEETIKTSLSSRTNIPTRKEVESFEKRISIEGKTYKVLLDTWNYKDDFYPACKIQDKVLYINKTYPLFKGTKFTDIFIKLHVLLLNGLSQKLLTRTSYEKISKNILKMYKDYI